MSIEPLSVALTNGEQLEVLKRFSVSYTEQMETVDAELREKLIANAEADFLAQYIGEQKEVQELRCDPAEIERLEKKRQHISAIIDRLTQVLPAQPDVKVQAPAAKISRF